MKSLICDREVALSEFLASGTRLGFYKIKKLISGGEVKVNGARVKSDVPLRKGDEVIIYAAEPPAPYKIVYSDDNVLFALKPPGMEVQGERSLEEQLRKDGIAAEAVNRLDRNTSGIVCLALNDVSYNALSDCFKNRQVTKKYQALVAGEPKPKHKLLKAFLFKDARQSVVYVSDVKKTGYVPIETEYTVKQVYDGYSRVEIILHTGKTHQIRAHMAHIGHPVLGDGKYSSNEINRRFGYKTQALAAVQYVFDMPKDNPMSYLNGKTIKIDPPF